MFVTISQFKSPASALLIDDDLSLWWAAELDTQKPWFILNYREAEEYSENGATGFATSRTMLVHGAANVAAVIRHHSSASRQFSAVYAVIPYSHSGSPAWCIQQLRSVLAAESPTDEGQYIEVLETVNGNLVPTTYVDGPIHALNIVEEVFRCPLENLGHGPKAAGRRTADRSGSTKPGATKA